MGIVFSYPKPPKEGRRGQKPKWGPWLPKLKDKIKAGRAFQTEQVAIYGKTVILRKKIADANNRDTIWKRLKEAGLSYKKPEKKYFEINKKDRLKWVRTEIPKILNCVRKYRAILYFQDESHISLTAMLGKTWGLKGKKTIVKVTSKRGGFSAMSTISRSGNLLFRLHEKQITLLKVKNGFIFFICQNIHQIKGIFFRCCVANFSS